MAKECRVCKGVVKNDRQEADLCVSCFMDWFKSTPAYDKVEEKIQAHLDKKFSGNCPSCGAETNKTVIIEDEFEFVGETYCQPCQAKEEAEVIEWIENAQPMLQEVVKEMDELLGDDDEDDEEWINDYDLYGSDMYDYGDS